MVEIESAVRDCALDPTRRLLDEPWPTALVRSQLEHTNIIEVMQRTGILAKVRTRIALLEESLIVQIFLLGAHLTTTPIVCKSASFLHCSRG